jgi:polyphosphate kinase 2 (PPK2 family)
VVRTVALEPTLNNVGVQEEQERRFEARLEDPVRQWKLSPMDLKSYSRWYAYSRARDMILEATDTKEAPGTSSVPTTSAGRV